MITCQDELLCILEDWDPADSFESLGCLIDDEHIELCVQQLSGTSPVKARSAV